jgi:hypothetical protein
MPQILADPSSPSCSPPVFRTGTKPFQQLAPDLGWPRARAVRRWKLARCTSRRMSSAEKPGSSRPPGSVTARSQCSCLRSSKRRKRGREFLYDATGAERFGSDATTRAAGLALCLLLPVPAMAPNLAALILALLLFGAANGMLDVSMNAQGVLVEDRYGRPILSSLHVLYSTGGLAGASLAALAAAVGIPAPAQTLGLAVVLGPSLLAVSRFLLRGKARRADRSPYWLGLPADCSGRALWRSWH